MGAWADKEEEEVMGDWRSGVKLFNFELVIIDDFASAWERGIKFLVITDGEI